MKTYKDVLREFRKEQLIEDLLEDNSSFYTRMVDKGINILIKKFKLKPLVTVSRKRN